MANCTQEVVEGAGNNLNIPECRESLYPMSRVIALTWQRQPPDLVSGPQEFQDVRVGTEVPEDD
jgi:hypothetical protein